MYYFYADLPGDTACQEYVTMAIPNQLPKTDPFDQPMKLGHCDKKMFPIMQNSTKAMGGMYNLYVKEEIVKSSKAANSNL